MTIGESPGVAVHAWRMTLFPGMAAEYRRRHNEIWPELAKELLAAGVIDFRIYHDPARDDLFAHLMASPDNSIAALREKPVMWKWWEMMSDIMETNADNSPAESPLDQVFHLAPGVTGETT